MLRKTNRIEFENKEEPDTNDVVVDRGEGNEWWCFKFQMPDGWISFSFQKTLMNE
jgi:hypothetical protein